MKTTKSISIHSDPHPELSPEMVLERLEELRSTPFISAAFEQDIEKVIYLILKGEDKASPVTVDGCITVLQSAGWLQQHDREIMSIYACIARLTSSGWMQHHDEELRRIWEAERILAEGSRRSERGIDHDQVP